MSWKKEEEKYYHWGNGRISRIGSGHDTCLRDGGSLSSRCHARCGSNRASCSLSLVRRRRVCCVGVWCGSSGRRSKGADYHSADGGAAPNAVHRAGLRACEQEAEEDGNKCARKHVCVQINRVRRRSGRMKFATTSSKSFIVEVK